MRYMLLALLVIPATSVWGADACNPAKLYGPYAFQLAGETSISGTPQPTVALGRVVFGDEGKISGTSSVKFAGLLLGNPLTGSYDAHRDCSVKLATAG